MARMNLGSLDGGCVLMCLRGVSYAPTRTSFDAPTHPATGVCFRGGPMIPHPLGLASRSPRFLKPDSPRYARLESSAPPLPRHMLPCVMHLAAVP